MSNLMKLMMGGGVQPLYSDDVFQSFTRTGTGASATVTTNIDMTKGYAVWSKGRSGATDHAVYDSARGVTLDLVTNSTAAATTQAQGLTAVSATGHTWGTLAKINTNTATYVDWVFRNSNRFFSHTSVVKSAGSNATASFPGLGTLGMVAVKRTDSTGSWYVWHRSLTAGNLLYLEQTAAEATLGHITVSGTTVTLVNGVIADGTYIVYAWAHDTEADGIIQCGSFTTDGSGLMSAPVNLGWEPQYVMFKQSSGVSSWRILDVMRGMSQSNDQYLLAVSSAAEAALNDANAMRPTATGFDKGNAFFNVSSTYIYLAIRRPNKPPTVGTQVYNAIARTGTGAAATVSGVGFAPDLVISEGRSAAYGSFILDRLRGAAFNKCYDIDAENATTDGITAYLMDGIAVGTYATTNAVINYVYQFFRRAPGFFDEVCDTGTGAAHTISHNLTVAPELMIRKGRSGATQWEVWHSAIANTEKLILDSTAAKATDTTAWNSTSPTASVFTVGTGANVNTNTATYVTYLFATLAGLSKCGSYTGNGTTQNIEMGFTTGARFFLVKAASTTGNWVLFDSVRGIIAGSDPYLLLNSTAAEDTDEDAVDPYSGGITVNETTASNINTNSVVYCYLAIA